MNPKTMPAKFKARWQTSRSSGCHVETCLPRVVLMAVIPDSSWALTPAGFRKEWKVRPMKTGYHPGLERLKTLPSSNNQGQKQHFSWRKTALSCKDPILSLCLFFSSNKTSALLELGISSFETHFKSYHLSESFLWIKVVGHSSGFLQISLRNLFRPGHSGAQPSVLYGFVHPW